jgi:hypothetical protein
MSRRILLTHVLHLHTIPFYNYPAYCLANFAIAVNIFSIKKPVSYMGHKKEIDQPLDTEQAKELELDETPKPTRKVSKPSVPVPNDAEPSTHDRIKGRRVIK